MKDTKSNKQLTAPAVKILKGGVAMATQTTQQKLEAANTLEEFVELLGGEENVVLMLQRAIKAKEASRVAHKKNYLRKQLVLKDPRVQALMKDLKVED